MIMRLVGPFAGRDSVSVSLTPLGSMGRILYSLRACGSQIQVLKGRERSTNNYIVKPKGVESRLRNLQPG